MPAVSSIPLNSKQFSKYTLHCSLVSSTISDCSLNKLCWLALYLYSTILSYSFTNKLTTFPHNYMLKTALYVLMSDRNCLCVARRAALCLAVAAAAASFLPPHLALN